MITTKIDTKALVARMTDIEKRQFPFAFRNALNDTAFDVRQGWSDHISSVFDRPTSPTLRAVIYAKATEDKPYADVGLKGSRVDAGRAVEDFTGTGIPPNKYLRAQVHGGLRRPKRSEVLLRQAGILGAGEFITPAHGFATDEFGNIKGGIVQSALSDLQASFDAKDRSTRKSRLRRLNRGSKKHPATVSRRSVFFYNRSQHGKLPRGIFQKFRTGFGDALRMVFAIILQPNYRPRFEAYKLAQAIWDRQFPVNFQKRFAQAMSSARR